MNNNNIIIDVSGNANVAGDATHATGNANVAGDATHATENANVAGDATHATENANVTGHNVTSTVMEIDTKAKENNQILSNTLQNVIPQMLYKESREFIIFKNELESIINNNVYILKECKSNKRLLDIRYAELEQKVSYIQISVIVLSTLSGFLQSTKEYFYTPDNVVSVCGISISTYISLILSVSKYYKFDENKESIHNLREKYGNLHNKIEFRMDILGPYTNYKLWEHQDASDKLKQWAIIKKAMDEEYVPLVETKQTLTTEFESIMDSKSRNENYIKDKELILTNREKLFNSMTKHTKLESKIKAGNISTNFDSIIQLPDDDLNNWDDPV